MKKQTCLTLFAVFLLFSGYAQDLIILRDGGEIKAKITEVGEYDIKYKDFDNPNGPVYQKRKTEIFFIKYENGKKETYSVVRKNMPNNRPISGTYRSRNARGITGVVVGSTFMVFGAAAIGLGIKNLNRASDYLISYNYELLWGDEIQANTYYRNYLFYDEAGVSYLATGISLAITSIPFLVMGPINLKKAKLLKQTGYLGGPTLTVLPDVRTVVGGKGVGSTYGAGISLKF
jgi:hypothetical protein